ncbi:MAG: threonine synthase [Pseudomonadota bacterium]|nr:threonine synthase [Pseudomonadota bacterium]
MKYISTRGEAPVLDFEQITLSGLASDGGLYVPEQWPRFSEDEIRAMRGLGYRALATRVIAPFCEGSLSVTELETLLDRAYDAFDHPAIAPVKQLDDGLFFMELFHGPTLAFKDIALQFLGPLFDLLLSRHGRRCTIVGATSGDTGSAAIEAVRGLEAVELFMLHPAGRVTDVQRRQMTTVHDANIHNLAVDGTFDDCQNLVKAMFNDRAFRERHALSAVNSINWARIAAQIVYYFRAALVLGAPDREVSFAVPTGNFGNAFAGYVAKQMGLPIRRFVIGSNRNDILTRFFASGRMEMRQVAPTLSPSMDIQISSNFERMLFEFYGRDGARTKASMTGFQEQGRIGVEREIHQAATDLFAAYRFDDEQTGAEIGRVYRDTGEIVDPHSVIGIAAAKAHLREDASAPVMALGTAHPAKFAPAVEAAIGGPVPVPERLEKVLHAEERYTAIANDLQAVERFIDTAGEDQG